MANDYGTYFGCPLSITSPQSGYILFVGVESGIGHAESTVQTIGNEPGEPLAVLSTGTGTRAVECGTVRNKRI